MRTIHIITVVLVAMSSGCATSRAAASTSGPGMNAKREASLKTLVASKLGCDEALISSEFIESYERNVHVYRSSGCGRTRDTMLMCVAMAGCHWIETPDTRAEFDLQCPQQKLSRTYLGSGTFGVAGCGRTITYVWVNGQFVANNSSTGVAPAPVAPQRSPDASSL